MMNDTIIWTVIGIPTGYIIQHFINHFYYMGYKTNISSFCKYSIITSFTLLAFLKGYSGNDLITNLHMIF